MCTTVVVHRSIRLRPQRVCEQEHTLPSNVILHDSAARAKHTRTHTRTHVRLLVVQWVVIGQYTMGRSLMDQSIKCPAVWAYNALPVTHTQTKKRIVNFDSVAGL